MNNQLVTKVCSKCKEEKPVSEFGKNKDGKNNLYSLCKICCNKKNKKYNSKHKDEKKIYDKQYNLKYKDKKKLRMKQYYLKNKDKIILNIKQNQSKNKDKIRIRQAKYTKNKRKIDNNIRILCNLRSRFYKALKGNFKSDHTMRLVGCSIPELKLYLQSLFRPEMDWFNYGKWVLHHKIECYRFDMSDPEQQKLCFHYTNIIPMWENEHRKLHSNNFIMDI